MTRRNIILQILSEASGLPCGEAEDIFSAMLEDGVLSNNDLDVEFSEAESRQLLEEFREELPGIRRWLVDLGLLPESGHA